jgi:hypothetical protein
MTKLTRSWTLAILLSLAIAACGDDGDDDDAPAPDGGPKADAAPGGPIYLNASIVFAEDFSKTSYVSILDSLAPADLDLADATELAGGADLWVYDGTIFVAEEEPRTITRYTVENGQLVAGDKVSFQAYGLPTFGFWINTFVSPTKAYVQNDAKEIIVWNPTTMTIGGTIDLPALESPDGMILRTGYTDRSAALRDGKVYFPLYWSDATYFNDTGDSRIVVVDTATDTIDQTITAPCPGLDHVTADGDGNLFFSSWVFAAGGALVLDQPATCIFQVPVTGTPARLFGFGDVTEGREGAALRYIGDERWIFSVLHGERVEITPETKPGDVTYGPNWRFWVYDGNTHQAAPVESIDWNAGAQYSFDIDQHTYTLVAEGNLTSTTIYDLGDGSAPEAILHVPGWSTRLFRLR